MIELSDDDDPDMVGEGGDDNEGDNKEEDEVQAEFCELRDAENLPDAEGRICIRRGATLAESFYLAPHIARVIKPHQVTSSPYFRVIHCTLMPSKKPLNKAFRCSCILNLICLF